MGGAGVLTFVCVCVWVHMYINVRYFCCTWLRWGMYDRWYITCTLIQLGKETPWSKSPRSDSVCFSREHWELLSESLNEAADDFAALRTFYFHPFLCVSGRRSGSRLLDNCWCEASWIGGRKLFRRDSPKRSSIQISLLSILSSLAAPAQSVKLGRMAKILKLSKRCMLAGAGEQRWRRTSGHPRSGSCI